MCGLLRSPPTPVCPLYLCVNVGPRGATCRSACPVLCHCESHPLGLSVRECRAVGSASGHTACPVGPTLHQFWSRHGNLSALCPGCPSPPLLLVWMNVSFLSTWCWTSLPFDSLSALVVQGGAVCLLTPPSWFSLLILFLNHIMKCIDLKYTVQSILINVCTHVIIALSRYRAFLHPQSSLVHLPSQSPLQKQPLF